MEEFGLKGYIKEEIISILIIGFYLFSIFAGRGWFYGIFQPLFILFVFEMFGIIVYALEEVLYSAAAYSPEYPILIGAIIWFIVFVRTLIVVLSATAWHAEITNLLIALSFFVIPGLFIMKTALNRKFGNSEKYVFVDYGLDIVYSLLIVMAIHSSG